MQSGYPPSSSARSLWTFGVSRAIRGFGTGAREWALRPYAVGLIISEPLPASQIALVLLLLASVSFDGFRDTPAWAAAVAWLGQESHGWVPILGLAALVSLFAGVYFGFCRLVVLAGASHPHPDGPAAYRSVIRIAGVFVLTLVPIAIAYNLAHYLSPRPQRSVTFNS